MATLSSEPHPLRFIRGLGRPDGHERSVDPARPRNARAALRNLWWLAAPHRRLLLVGLVLIAVNRAASFVLPGSTKFLIDGVIGKHQTHLLLPLIGAVIAGTAVQALTSFALAQTISKAAQRLIAELRVKVHAHVGRLPVAYFDANATGGLTARVMNDVEGVRTLLGTGLISFVGGALTSLVAFCVLLRISVFLTAVTLPVMLILGFAMWKSFSVLRPLFRERSRLNARVSARLAESLAGIRVIKAYQAEAREDAEFGNGVRGLLENSLRTLTTISWVGLASSLSIGFLGALIMLLGTWQIEAGALTVGGLFAYTLFLGFLVVPLAQIAGAGTQLGESIAGLERTHELLLEPTEDVDPARTVALPFVTGDIVFEHVTFAYATGEEVLSDVSLHAAPGTTTALVGSTGSGKSTIIGLVAAFYRPTEGKLFVDGVDLATVRLDSYRHSLGAVLQDPFLFDGTIRENVALSRPDAAEAMVQLACDTAHVSEFAERLPEKYDTVVGERAVRLSGGQRQRISIARAVLADPRILILDEATSNFDSESEALVQDGLRRLMRGRTTLVIAHRLSTIRSADQILVVEGGRIVERGDHATLHAARGRYYALYERQYQRGVGDLMAEGDGRQASADDRTYGDHPS